MIASATRHMLHDPLGQMSQPVDRKHRKVQHMHSDKSDDAIPPQKRPNKITGDNSHGTVLGIKAFWAFAEGRWSGAFFHSCVSVWSFGEGGNGVQCVGSQCAVVSPSTHTPRSRYITTFLP